MLVIALLDTRRFDRNAWGGGGIAIKIHGDLAKLQEMLNDLIDVPNDGWRLQIARNGGNYLGQIRRHA